MEEMAEGHVRLVGGKTIDFETDPERGVGEPASTSTGERLRPTNMDDPIALRASILNKAQEAAELGWSEIRKSLDLLGVVDRVAADKKQSVAKEVSAYLQYIVDKT